MSKPLLTNVYPTPGPSPKHQGGQQTLAESGFQP